MHLTFRPRQLAYVLVAALLLAAAAGGVGYAAGSPSKNVSACVNGKGRLALQNARGKCPKKFKQVAIAKRGPRGATGPRGASGARGGVGARGPGATALVQDFTAAGNGTSRVVGGLSYTPSCPFSAGNPTVALVTVRAVSGANVSVREIRAVVGSAPEALAFGPALSPTVVFATGVGTTSTAMVTGALVFSGTTTQTVSLSVTANDVAAPPGGIRCSIRGTITPAA